MVIQWWFIIIYWVKIKSIIISNHVKVLYGFYWCSSMIFYHLRVFLLDEHPSPPRNENASWRRWCASALPCPTAQRSPVLRWSSPSGPLTGQRLNGVHHFGLSERSFPKIPHPIPSPNSSICCFRMFHLIQSGVPMGTGTPSGNLMKPPFLVPLIIVCPCLWSVLYDLRLYVSEKPHHIQKSLWKTRTTFLFPWQFHRFFWGPQSHEATKLLREVPEVLVGN